MSHTKEDLKELQSKSLDEKIQISTARIIEWYKHWDGKVYISNSGGVDSTVLSDLVHRVYPDVPDVFVDTGLEYPELKEFIKSKPNVITLHPTMNFVEVIKKYGYPLISKDVSEKVYNNRMTPNGYTKDRFNPDSEYNKKYPQFDVSKWKFLTEADFLIGNNCCNVMKKHPAKVFEKRTGLHPYIGTMTEESHMRRSRWLKYGCNAFDEKRAISTPLAFWTKNDVLQYLYINKIPYASVYGDIVEKDGKYITTNLQRTGCVYCGYGQHLCKKSEKNAYQKLAKTHPQLYDYCMRGGKYDESTGMWIPDKGLGMAKVLDYINVKWWNDGDEAKRDEYRAKYKEKEEIEQSRKKSSQTD